MASSVPSLAIVPYAAGDPPAISSPLTPDADAASSAGGGAAHAPPSQHKKRRGLMNQGATCYMNSLLQTLFHTPEFRRVLYLWEYDADKDGDAEDCIPLQLQHLFGQLQLSDARAVSTSALTKSFGWSGHDAFEQHDVQELARVLFDALERALAGTPNSALSQNLFKGSLRDYLKCKECGAERARADAILDLSLVIRPFGASHSVQSIEEALQADYVTTETLDGDNAVTCASDGCGGRKTPHVKGLRIAEPPYLLQLQLKRFVFNYETLSRTKVNDRVTFPLLLDLNKYVVPDDAAVAPAAAGTAVEAAADGDAVAAVVAAPAGDDAASAAASSETDTISTGSLAASPPSATALSSADDVAAAAAAGAGAAAAGDGGGGSLQQRALALLDASGPHVYELYAVLVHSGSALGGHYYAYIRDLDDPDADGAWSCYNDSTVSPATVGEVLATAGGATRGYGGYSFASSANAYMLMYRRVLRGDFVEIRSREAASGAAGGTKPAVAGAAEGAPTDAAPPPSDADAAAAPATGRERADTASSAAAAVFRMPRCFPGDGEVPAAVRGLLEREEAARREREAREAEERAQMTVKVFHRGEARQLRIRRDATVAAATEAAWRLFHLDGSAPTPRAAAAGGARPRGSPLPAASSRGSDDDDASSTGAAVWNLFEDGTGGAVGDDDAADTGATAAPLEPVTPVPLACVRLREYAAANDLPKAPLSYDPRPVAAVAGGEPSPAAAAISFATWTGTANSAGSGVADGWPADDATASAAGGELESPSGGAGDYVSISSSTADSSSSMPGLETDRPAAIAVATSPIFASGSGEDPIASPSAHAAQPAAVAAAAGGGGSSSQYEDGSQRRLDEIGVFSYKDLIIETRGSPDEPWPAYDPTAIAVQVTRYVPLPAPTAESAAGEVAAPTAAAGAPGLGSFTPAVRVLVGRDATLAELGEAAATATGVPRARQRLLRLSVVSNTVGALEFVTHASLALPPLPVAVAREAAAAGAATVVGTDGAVHPLPRDRLNRILGDTTRLGADLNYPFRGSDSFTLYVEEVEPAAAAPAAPAAVAAAGAADDDFDPFGTNAAAKVAAAAPAAAVTAPSAGGDDIFDGVDDLERARRSAAAAAASADGGSGGTAHPPPPSPSAASAVPSPTGSTSTAAGGAGSGGLIVTNHSSGGSRVSWSSGAAAATRDSVDRGFRLVAAAASQCVQLYETRYYSGTWKYNLPSEASSTTATAHPTREIVLDTRLSSRQLYAALARELGQPVGTFTVKKDTAWARTIKLSVAPGALRDGSMWSRDGTLVLAPGPALEAAQFLVHVYLHALPADVVPGTTWLPALPPPPPPPPPTSLAAPPPATPASAPPTDATYGGWFPVPITPAEAEATAQAALREGDAESTGATAAAAAATQQSGQQLQQAGGAPSDSIGGHTSLSPLASSLGSSPLRTPGGASADAAAAVAGGSFGDATATNLPSTRGSVASAPPDVTHAPAPQPPAAATAAQQPSPAALPAEPKLLLQLGVAKDMPLDALRCALAPKLLAAGALTPSEVVAVDGGTPYPPQLLRRLRLRQRTSGRPGRPLPDAPDATAGDSLPTMWDGLELTVEVLPPSEAEAALRAQQVDDTHAAAAAAAGAAAPSSAAAGGGAFFAASGAVTLSAYRPGAAGGGGGPAPTIPPPAAAAPTSSSSSFYSPPGSRPHPIIAYAGWWDRGRWAGVGARREVLLSSSESFRLLARRLTSLPGLAAAAQGTLDAVKGPYADAERLMPPQAAAEATEEVGALAADDDGAASSASSTAAATAELAARFNALKLDGGAAALPPPPAPLPAPSADTDAAAPPAPQVPPAPPPSPGTRLRTALHYAVVAPFAELPPPRALPGLHWRRMGEDARTVSALDAGVYDGCTILLMDADVPLPPLTAADRRRLGLASASGSSSDDGEGTAGTGAGAGFAFNFNVPTVGGELNTSSWVASGASSGKYGSLSWNSSGADATAATSSSTAVRPSYRSKETGLKILTKAERDAAKKAKAAAAASGSGSGGLTVQVPPSSSGDGGLSGPVPLGSTQSSSAPQSLAASPSYASLRETGGGDGGEVSPPSAPVAGSGGEATHDPHHPYTNPLLAGGGGGAKAVGWAASRARQRETEGVLAAVHAADAAADAATDAATPLSSLGGAPGHLLEEVQ